MKKLLIAVLVSVALFYGCFYGYSYYNGAKIKDGIISKSIDSKGRPTEFANEFSPEETVYFSAKVNRFWVKKAQVVWYQGDIAIANRYLVEEDVRVNKAGYFVAKLSAPEGLKEGHYSVTIYEKGNDIRETYADFYIKKNRDDN